MFKRIRTMPEATIGKLEGMTRGGDSYENSIYPKRGLGVEKEYFGMEKLANLDKLPSHGFTVYCLPIQISEASAGWVRPVTVVEE
jgi:kynurenine formamidase